MKTIIRLAFLSILSVLLYSCNKKTELPDNKYMSNEPSIVSKIYPYVSQPYEMTLGKSGSIFRTGDKIVIFLPYQLGNEEIVSAMATAKDASNGEIIGAYDLVLSTD